MSKTKEVKEISYNGKIYLYEYRAAINGDSCLATKDPNKYFNGIYKYSSKDPGSGICFVIVDELCGCINPFFHEDRDGINYCVKCYVEVSLTNQNQIKDE